ncbi:MAG: hypothetical protein KBS76_06950, partial [Ruminococcus sp.]|nr:hypothetical protein [Candidatus Apopatosoma intestinale]
MTEKDFQVSGKTLRLSAFADGIVRVRVSDTFAPTYFERYGIYEKPDETVGEMTENGVRAGALTVSVSGETLTFGDGRFTRTVSFSQDKLSEKSAYFDEKLCGFRPERKKIVGDETADDAVQYIDFVKDPKYITVLTEGERFYGLGESNTDRIVLNGKTYLNRIVYTKSEIVIPFLMTKVGYGILCNSS